MLERRVNGEAVSYLPMFGTEDSSEIKRTSSFETTEVTEVVEEAERALKLIQQLFLYRKECGLRTSAYHQNCLLVRKTSTVIDVHLDLSKHQDINNPGNKVFQAEYLDSSWQVACCKSGIWIKQLAMIVKGYKSQCFGSIDDRKYFPLANRL